MPTPKHRPDRQQLPPEESLPPPPASSASPPAAPSAEAPAPSQTPRPRRQPDHPTPAAKGGRPRPAGDTSTPAPLPAPAAAPARPLPHPPRRTFAQMLLERDLTYRDLMEDMHIGQGSVRRARANPQDLSIRNIIALASLLRQPPATVMQDLLEEVLYRDRVDPDYAPVPTTLRTGPRPRPQPAADPLPGGTAPTQPTKRRRANRTKDNPPAE